MNKTCSRKQEIQNYSRPIMIKMIRLSNIITQYKEGKVKTKIYKEGQWKKIESRFMLKILKMFIQKYFFEQESRLHFTASSGCD